MNAGRELDTLVAEKVMGWTAKDGRWHDADGKDLGSDHADNDLGLGDYYYPDEHWSPSTDISSAWEVVEKLQADGWGLSLDSPGFRPGQWRCLLQRCDSPDDGRVRVSSLIEVEESTTGPHAICLAALKSVGVAV